VLLLLSASVIELFVDTVDKVPVLAMFLPVVAGLCGSGGNQAVGVSLREISLGLIGPNDIMRVMVQEVSVALFTGMSLGVMLFGVVFVWQGNIHLAIAVAGAVPVVTLISKCVGGTAPLLLRKVGLDPAMASGPLVTTVTDLCSFICVLLFAYLLLDYLAPMVV